MRWWDELPPDVHPVARALRKMRRKFQISAAELAGMLDVKTCTVCMFELGRLPVNRTKRNHPRAVDVAALIARAEALLERWAQVPPDKRHRIGVAKHPNKGGNRNPQGLGGVRSIRTPRKALHCDPSHAAAQPLRPVATRNAGDDRRARHS